MICSQCRLKSSKFQCQPCMHSKITNSTLEIKSLETLQADLISTLVKYDVPKRTQKVVVQEQVDKEAQNVVVLKEKIQLLKTKIQRIKISIKIPISFTCQDEINKKKEILTQLEKKLNKSRNLLKLKLLDIFNFRILSGPGSSKLYINNLEFSFQKEIPKEMFDWSLQLIFHFLIMYAWYFDEFYPFSLNWNEIVVIIANSIKNQSKYLELLAKTRYNLRYVLNTKECALEKLIINLATLEKDPNAKENIEYKEILKEIYTEFSQKDQKPAGQEWEFV